MRESKKGYDFADFDGCQIGSRGVRLGQGFASLGEIRKAANVSEKSQRLCQKPVTTFLVDLARRLHFLRASACYCAPLWQMKFTHPIE